jgi:hypothetical protein
VARKGMFSTRVKKKLPKEGEKREKNTQKPVSIFETISSSDEHAQ